MNQSQRPTALLREPTQPRASQTVEKILGAATRILVEEDITALNTNRIARDAGVNIATLYTYFKDKFAIIEELAIRMEYMRSNQVVSEANAFASMDWREWVSTVIDEVVETRRQTYGMVAVRRALLSSADLQPIDARTTTEVAEAQVDGLLAHSSQLDRQRALEVSRVMVNTVTGLLDEAFRSEPYDETLIRELKPLIIGYLSNYLDN